MSAAVSEPKRPRGRPKDPNSKRSKGELRGTDTKKTFSLQQPLWDAFHAYLESHGEDEPRPDDSEVLRAALRGYLRAKGFWPWPQ
jgi:hypothetical protein